MSDNYKVYKIKDFLRMTEKGTIDLNKSLSIIHHIVIASNYHKDCNLLLDVREVDGTLNHLDIVKVAMELVFFKDSFRNKIAILDRDIMDYYEKNEYLKSRLKPHDFQIEFFYDNFEQAIEWLSDIKMGEL
jgi:hypothetical protein